MKPDQASMVGEAIDWAYIEEGLAALIPLVTMIIRPGSDPETLLQNLRDTKKHWIVEAPLDKKASAELLANLSHALLNEANDLRHMVTLADQFLGKFSAILDQMASPDSSSG